MAVRRTIHRRAYGIGNSLQDLSPLPIVAQRAPSTRDTAEVGTVWIDQSGNDIYMLLEVVANSSSWTPIGAGAGVFDSVVSTTTITAGTGLTVTTGNVTVGDFATAGVLFNDASGVLASNAGTDGQVIIAATGAAPAFASIVSGDGSMSVTAGANTLDLRVTGAAASTFPTDVGTATPVLGATTITGGTNVNTAGAGGVVTVNVDNAPTFSGLVTAQAGITQSAGTATIVSDTNGAQAIYLHENGGVGGTIDIHADQGTGAGAAGTASVGVYSDVGGVTLDGGIAAVNAIYLNASDAAGGIDIDAGTAGVAVDTTGAISFDSAAASNFTVTGAFDLTLDSTLGSVVIDGGEAVADAIQITASDAAGGVTGAVGTGGYILGATNGPFTLTTGTGNISIGADAAAKNISIGNATGATAIDIDAGTGACTILSNATDHTITFGSTTGVSALTTQAGTGAMTFTAGGIFDVNAAGNVTIDSSGGTIGIGVDAVAQNINIGTGAAQRDIVIGNTTGTTSFTAEAGTGATTFTAGGIFDVNGTGNITIDSTGGTIGIGVDADANNINIGTGAAQRDITVGNATGTSSFTVDCGTGGCSIGASATAHTTTIGSTNTTSDTTIQSGTGGITLSAAGIVDMVPATDTQAAASCTVNANVGYATYTGLTTASGATQVLTVVNSVCTTSSAILVTVANVGANDAKMTIERIEPLAGSFEVECKNNGSQALNGNVTVTFWIMKA